MSDLFTLWTPAAVLTAILSGIAMAAVVMHLRPHADTRLTSYLAAVLGLLWYLPIATQRFLDGAVPDGSASRTLGNLLLYELAFVLPLALTLSWYRRRHP